MADRSVALVAPPSWYYATVPADLTWIAGHLRAHAVDVELMDLSATVQRDLLGANDAWATLRSPGAYLDPRVGVDAAKALFTDSQPISAHHRVHFGPRGLSFPDVDGADLQASLAVGLDPARNPALPTLWSAVGELVERAPDVIAVAMVHPEQRVGAPVLARLLRTSGYRGELVLYGSLEDVLAPMDLAPDLVGDPRHELWRDFDAVVVGEGESALLCLARGQDAPNVLRPGATALPPLHREDLATLSDPSFEGFDPDLYPYPTPIVDLRVGRGCPWGRCAFCAIQAHQPGWRAAGADRAVRAMQLAHDALGTTWFRVRDDLLTPTQLADLGRAAAALPFRPHWTARARFSPQLNRSALGAARDGGLDELWLGLESASERVRDSMDKGVRDDVVERVLSDCHALGIRVRALCLLGFPGETEAEARQTLDFLDRNAHRLASAALTPFQLMRNSPMALDLERHGIEVAPDPIPRERRMRHRIEARIPGAMPTDAVRTLIRQAGQRLMPRFADPWGPTLEHAWMRACWTR